MMAALAAATAFTTLFAVAATAGPAAAAGGNGCPTNKVVAGLPTATNVGASFFNAGNTTTYTFSSLTNENPSGGVPGLMKYCVYPSPTSQPTMITPQATGANGAKWISSKGSNNFAFVRPGGDKTNIPLNGNTTTMGTATWATAPTTDQTIVLHINDPTVCRSLYGATTPATCFVKPGATGPVCDKGDTNAAYNAMPFDVVNCLNPAIGFEATSTSEFGDKVGLAGTARKLVSLKVDFQSFACETGHWNGDGSVENGPACSSGTGAEFTHDITANLYNPSNLTTPLATVTTPQTIPYRPSADPSCPAGGGAPDGARWFNPNAPGGGACQNSIGKVLTFNFPSGTTLPDTVVWTVAFNTTHYGAPAIGEGAACFGTSGGCPYDSLNVGDKSYSGAPYAGTDSDANEAFLDSTWDGAYCDGGLGGIGTLRSDSPCWTGFRPLGEIITST
jgi:hypothetical protein